MSSMREMKMPRHQLLAALHKNLELHRAEFLEAQEGYRRALIKEIDRMLSDARNNRAVARHISLPEPSDHSADYQVAIRMLDMCVDVELDISIHDFERYVMDDWGWKGKFSETVSNYKGD